MKPSGKKQLGASPRATGEPSAQPPARCDICNKEFKNTQGLAAHRLRSHGQAPTPSPTTDPYLVSLNAEMTRLKSENRLLASQLEQFNLKARLPDISKPASPSMTEIAMADFLEAKTAALKNPPQGGVGDSNPLAAEVRDLRARLDDRRDRELEELRAEVRDVRAHPASGGSEKVELSRLVVDGLDHVGDRMSDKLQPLIDYIFKGSPMPPKEIAPGAREGLLKNLKPEWISES